MKKFLLSISFLILTQTSFFAQQSDSTITQTENSDSTEISFWKKHKVNFAALANAFFKVAPTDTVSPLSMAGAMLGYTTNKTWYWALFTRLYMDEDNYRATLGYGDASVNFQYYEDMLGGFIDLTLFINFS